MTRSIVLIHAVRSSRTMWKGQRRRLREHGYEVRAPDLPGHGSRRGLQRRGSSEKTYPPAGPESGSPVWNL